MLDVLGELEMTMSDRGAVEVLIVDDHALLGQALAVALVRAGVTTATLTDLDPTAIVEEVVAREAAVAVLDLYGPSGSTLAAIGPLVASGASVVVLTGSDRPGDIAACLQAGADIVLHKGLTLRSAVEVIKGVLAGARVLSHDERDALIADGRAEARTHVEITSRLARLTAREREVLAGLIEGRPAQTIADDTHVSVRTIRSHIEAILRKLEVSSQLAAVALARRARWNDVG